jgi:hypothetical protein
MTKLAKQHGINKLPPRDGFKRKERLSECSQGSVADPALGRAPSRGSNPLSFVADDTLTSHCETPERFA